MPPSMIETHRTTINTWECDDNGHMNVQFYFRRFEEASEHLATAASLAGHDATQVACRHVRYHSEVHAGDGIAIQSGIVAGGPFAGHAFHMMTKTETGELAATSLDSRRNGPESRDATEPGAVALPEMAHPRSIPAGHAGPTDTAVLIESGKAIISNRHVVRREDCDAEGMLRSSAVIGRFTDGALHAWAHGGITGQWLRSRNLGRVAVEMKQSRLGNAGEGTPVRLVSWIGDAFGKTFLISHQLEDARDGRALARGDVRCLIMDLESRKAVSLPDEFLARFDGSGI